MALFGGDNSALGIDVGSSSIKILKLKQLKGGDWALEAHGERYLPPEAIVDGTVMNTGIVVDSINELISELHIGSVKNVNLSVSGNAVIIKRISMQQMTFDELEEQIRWEAEQYIPYDTSDVNIDVQILSEDEGDSGQMDVLLAAARKDLVGENMSLIQQAGLNPVLVDVDSFAVANTFAANYEPPPGTIALVNIGSTSVNIHILRAGTSVFTRDLSLGGRQYTEEIQRTLNISYEEAEKMKVGDPEEKAVITSEISQILRGVSENIAGEIQRTLDFYLSTSPDGYIDQIFLSGGGALTSGLSATISSVTGIYSEVIDPFRLVQVDERNFKPDFLTQDGPKYTVALGLAMRQHGALAEEELPICVNLVPQKTSRRYELVRQEFNNALAGLFLICVAFFGVYYVMNEDTSSTSRINNNLQQQIQKNKKAVDTVTLLEEERKSLQEKLEAIEQLKRAKKGPVRMMDELSKSTPEKLKLTSLSETEGRVKITGFAAAEPDVSKFLTNLEGSEFFSNVLPNNIEQVEEDGIKLKSFSITARLIVPNAPEEPKVEKKKKRKR